VFAIVIKANLDQFNIINKNEKLLSSIPKNSTILSSFNQQYDILFVRPDLKIIPSCEIGLPSRSIHDEYIAFFKSGAFRALASKTGVAYLVEAQDMYLDPRECRYLQFMDNYNKIRVWKILGSPN
jgi:hypothetical protein